jgi:hypothetical protein
MRRCRDVTIATHILAPSSARPAVRFDRQSTRVVGLLRDRSPSMALVEFSVPGSGTIIRKDLYHCPLPCLTGLAHDLIRGVLTPGDGAVDAAVGHALIPAQSGYAVSCGALGA